MKQFAESRDMRIIWIEKVVYNQMISNVDYNYHVLPDLLQCAKLSVN